MAVLTSSYHYNIIKKYLCAKYRRQSVAGYFMKKRIATIVTTFVLASALSVPEEKKDVYITKTGKKYHNDDTCNGGTYWPVPLSTALGMNLQPCDKCVY